MQKSWEIGIMVFVGPVRVSKTRLIYSITVSKPFISNFMIGGTDENLTGCAWGRGTVMLLKGGWKKKQKKTERGWKNMLLFTISYIVYKMSACSWVEGRPRCQIYN